MSSMQSKPLLASEIEGLDEEYPDVRRSLQMASMKDIERSRAATRVEAAQPADGHDFGVATGNQMHGDTSLTPVPINTR